MTQYLLLLRFSEIAIKSKKTRQWLITLLVKNIEHCLNLFEINSYTVVKEYSRIYIFSERILEIQRIISVYVPGIVSSSIGIVVETEFSEITKTITQNIYPKLENKKSFVVRVNRTGTHDFSSMEFAAKIGEFILDYYPHEISVDLHNPEYTLSLDIRGTKTYIFDTFEKGLAGLPAGSQGNVLVLFEGTENDFSTLIQLYKRGVTVHPYLLKPKTNFEGKTLKTLNFIRKLQNLPDDATLTCFDENETVESIIATYTHLGCLGIGLSKELFEVYSSRLPLSLPLFVPLLTDELDENELIPFYSINMS